MALIECIPNVSEGRRSHVIADLTAAVTSTGVALLDVHSDAVHNRSVFTFVGSAPDIAAAVHALFDAAVSAIDLRGHQGAHPRLGAVDVVPFVPIGGVTLDECVALACTVGAEVAARHALPVFLYGAAAAIPARRRLEYVRRGQFEGLAARMATAEGAPDFGPPVPHPSAGAAIFGARLALIAYNINLSTDRLEIAKTIASSIRESSGGLAAVKALGIALPDRGIVQVSMNLTDFRRTPIEVVFERVRREAAGHGVTVLESELVGLIPEAALRNADPALLQLRNFSAAQILEHRISAAGRTPLRRTPLT